MVRTLRFDGEEWKKMQALSESGYPREVCGLLLGTIEKGEPLVRSVENLENMLTENHRDRLKALIDKRAVALPAERMARGGAFEFVIDPQEHLQKLLAAQNKGWDQIGLFHSHPDHPAQPSPTDAAQPFLAGWSNIIVAVHGGKFKEARSWYRAEETETFQEERIVIQ